MMTIQQMIDAKNRSGFTYEQISTLSGVPLGTVQKVLGGITASPRYETLLALERVLAPENEPGGLREDTPAYGCNTGSDYITEGSTALKKQGEYTIEDYYALPDEQRVELIDGVFYDMSAPTTIHQIIGLGIANQIKNYISSNKGQCVPLISPCDVQLDMDNKTMIQPDFMIVCDRSKIIRLRVYGAPDFIVEVLSPSTRKKDMSLKVSKYENAGVREYWLIEPDKQVIVVYTFEGEGSISFYSFKDKVPVYIYDGKCEVDFAPILEDIEFLL